MCLAVPMKIIKKDGFSAMVEAGGVSREINLRLLEDAGWVIMCWCMPVLP